MDHGYTQQSMITDTKQSAITDTIHSGGMSKLPNLTIFIAEVSYCHLRNPTPFQMTCLLVKNIVMRLHPLINLVLKVADQTLTVQKFLFNRQQVSQQMEE